MSNPPGLLSAGDPAPRSRLSRQGVRFGTRITSGSASLVRGDTHAAHAGFPSIALCTRPHNCSRSIQSLCRTCGRRQAAPSPCLRLGHERTSWKSAAARRGKPAPHHLRTPSACTYPSLAGPDSRASGPYTLPCARNAGRAEPPASRNQCSGRAG